MVEERLDDFLVFVLCTFSFSFLSLLNLVGLKNKPSRKRREREQGREPRQCVRVFYLTEETFGGNIF